MNVAKLLHITNLFSEIGIPWENGLMEEKVQLDVLSTIWDCLNPMFRYPHDNDVHILV